MPIRKLENKKWKWKKKGQLYRIYPLDGWASKMWGLRFISILTRNFIAYSSHFTFFIWRGTHLSVCFWRNRSGLNKIRSNLTNANFLVSLPNSMLTEHKVHRIFNIRWWVRHFTWHDTWTQSWLLQFGPKKYPKI